MDCGSYREIISAELDGEASPLRLSALRDHLSHCTTCARFQAHATVLTRSIRILLHVIDAAAALAVWRVSRRRPPRRRQTLIAA
jgi:predicted anti-sigma-YlaC factor YlaD